MRRVYAQVWFPVRKRPDYADRHRDLCQIVQFAMFLLDELKKAARSVVETNGCYGHLENLLTAMVTDDNQDIGRIA